MLGDPKAGELCFIKAMFVETRSGTDVQVVRYTRVWGGSLFPTGQLELNNFHQVKRMFKRNRQRVVLDLLSNFKMGKNQCLLW